MWSWDFSVPDRGHKMAQMAQFFCLAHLDPFDTQPTPKLVPKSVKLKVVNMGSEMAQLGPFRFQCPRYGTYIMTQLGHSYLRPI